MNVKQVSSNAKYADITTKFGYTLTKKGDLAAIMMGGVPYMVGNGEKWSYGRRCR